MNDALAAFDRFLGEHRLDPSSAWPMKVALDEILSNIVEHAYAGRSDGVIDLLFALADGSLEITVVDDGAAVDPLTCPQPDVTSDLMARRPGGLGVYLVKELSDHIEYARREGRNWLAFGRRVG